MRKLYIIALAVLALCGCDAMLDTTNYSKYDTSNYPKSQKDAEQILTGTYYALAGCVNDSEKYNLYVTNNASDDMFGGGSTSNYPAQAQDRLMIGQQEGLDSAWENHYKGIFRANYALSVIPDMDDSLFESKDAKNYLIGQAYFLRAFFFWQMYELFETFPCVTTIEPVNIPRTSAEDVMKQIAEDLVAAIETMPAQYKYTLQSGLSGRATKYAAEALLGRVWLFYTGFYKKSDLNGISKSKMAEYLKDCVANSGFGLEDDPREIWPYTNDYSSGVAYETDFNTYSSKNDLHWVGNHSKETLFAIHFSYVDRFAPFYNRMGERYGLRNKNSKANDACYPYGIGYTNGTVNSNFVKDWHEDPDYGPADKRLWGSLMAVDNAAEVYPWLTEEEVELASHPGNDSKEVEKTMFHNKKYIVVTAYSGADKAQLYNNFFKAFPGGDWENHNQYDNRNDLIFIRYADVLLMLDEIEETVTGMNALRTRAGLAAYDSYSLERLQKERRYELCFEGVRFNDLRRWYPETAGDIISQNQVGAFIENRGKVVDGGWVEVPGNGIPERYRQTRGFWKIADTEINLSEGVLEETPGWTSTNTKEWLFLNGDLPYVM